MELIWLYLYGKSKNGVAQMAEPWLRFPVVCPECRREELSALPVAGVAAALLSGSAIPLHASCQLSGKEV
jgi:hypothetical protein